LLGLSVLIFVSIGRKVIRIFKTGPQGGDERRWTPRAISSESRDVHSGLASLSWSFLPHPLADALALHLGDPPTRLGSLADIPIV
jgi:hypothetical protein